MFSIYLFYYGFHVSDSCNKNIVKYGFHVTKISLKITCLVIAATGLLATVSTLNLMKNSIPTTFAQPMTTATNNTQGMLMSKFPFKPGIFVTPMSCMRYERFKLLVVDSPVTHYRSEYLGRAKLPERQQRIQKFIRRLVKIGHTYNLAIVVTNHINPTQNYIKMSVKAAGGNIMGHAVTYRVQLWSGNNSIFYARKVGSPYHPQKTKSFYISAKGLVDDDPSAVDLPPLSTFDWDSFLDT